MTSTRLAWQVTPVTRSAALEGSPAQPLYCLAAPRRSPIAAFSPSPSPSSSSSSSSLGLRLLPFTPLRPSWRAGVQLPQWNFGSTSTSTTTAQDSSSAASSPAASDAAGPPTVSDTKQAFLLAYPLPIPAIYNTVIQELLVQQHLVRYQRNYNYDPVFALGFVTVYDQLMDGYPNAEQRDAIFTAYIKALQEDPVQYRADAERLEKWASELPSTDALVQFATRDGGVEGELKAISKTISDKAFHYSRFFAVGLFRLLELAKASDPAVLQQLCEALGVNKMSVNRDLDVYRGLLSKLTQAKELLRDFLKREKAKKAERQGEVAGREKETAEVKKE